MIGIFFSLVCIGFMLLLISIDIGLLYIARSFSFHLFPSIRRNGKKGLSIYWLWWFFQPQFRMMP